MTNCSNWSLLLSSIKANSTIYGFDLVRNSLEYIEEILKQKRLESNYWKLVFRAVSFTSEDVILEQVGKPWLNEFFIELKADIYKLGHELFGNDFPEFKIHKTEVIEKKHPQKRKFKPNSTWYPRYLHVMERMDILKEIKGSNIGIKLLDPLSGPYEEVKQVADYAKNRHRFNIKKGWWLN